MIIPVKHHVRAYITTTGADRPMLVRSKHGFRITTFMREMQRNIEEAQLESMRFMSADLFGGKP